MTLAPIILFVYNRPIHTRKTIDALKQNFLANESNLYIFSDGSKNDADFENVNQVREIINNVDGFKNVYIFESYNNNGLANSVINGISEVLKTNESVIVLEDDIVTTNNFLNFINFSLNKLQKEEKVFSISGYLYPIESKDVDEDVFYCSRSSSWGWATWKDRWESVDWNIKDYDNFIKDKSQVKAFNQAGNDLSFMLSRQMSGEINSWAIRFCYAAFRQNKIHAFPKISKVTNIGNDSSGVHSPKTDAFNSLLDASNKTEFTFPKQTTVNNKMNSLLSKKYSKSAFRRFVYRLMSKITH